MQPSVSTQPVPSHADELDSLASDAQNLVEKWLRATADAHVKPHASAARLSAILQDPKGLDFTVGFVDRVIGTEDTRAAAQALDELSADLPKALSALDRAQIRAGGIAGRKLPDVVIPTARHRMRSMVGHMIVDARERPFRKTVTRLRSDGNRLNINPLGEAVLGDGEATNHLNDAAGLLHRDDVDYVSIKVSSVASQISMWGFEETVEYVVDRLAPMYLAAAQADTAGSRKFINLDMEEYRDLRLTIEVFTRLLSMPELKNFEAGIVLQAYLPDALGAMQQLSEFASARVADGGAGIKVRLVKGANLAMERVHAEVAGWPLVTCESKAATDANYKLVLHWAFTREHLAGLRIGVAGHNLFDIAFAHLLSETRGVTDRIEFEMLQGMASEQADVISRDVGQLLLYVPTVKPQEFDVAISYLVRRLEENAASENFMSGIFELTPGGEIFRREADRFHTAVDLLRTRLDEAGHTPPPPRDTQNRLAEAEPSDVAADAAHLPAFHNEPDTNPALEANQRWAKAALERAVAPGWLDGLPLPAPLTEDDVDALVETARTAAVEWSARPAAERAALLYKAADLLAQRRGELVSIVAAEVGKAVEQSDPEISEAIDFARYYAHRALELDTDELAQFAPDRVVVVTPPWNFPLAIPAGGTFAALAAGAAVIHKPSAPTPHCSMAILEALWDAGVPREVCHGVFPDEGPAGKKLISHPDVDRVILTGASDTASLFSSWRSDLRINAETSGKNALIVTPAADRDLAIADLVHSAFGHAGQKCSAASLGILVGSVYDSQRFRKQLVDAASSLVVDWPSNASATVGPLTEAPSDKLTRALTTLEPGEKWLLKPRRLDDTGRLWSPGVKDGVKPGSFFHLTECFGPVLGLMRADDLDTAIELQNATDFGLTAGLHSLEAADVRTWLDRVQAGNLYVNRGITGAIVRRQPFGGWKRSSVGLGSKAGGPNYLMLFGRWTDRDGVPGVVAGTPKLPEVAAFLKSLSSDDLVDAEAAAWLGAAANDDDRAWRVEFGAPRDETGLQSEANIFRYRPTSVVLRVAPDATAAQTARVLIAAHRAGASVTISCSPEVGETVAGALEAATRLGFSIADRRTDGEFNRALADGAYDDGVGARVRFAGSPGDDVFARMTGRPEVALLDDPITASGRVELRYWLHEQSVSMTLHRFGNPDPAFHTLAKELTEIR
ncbi:MAG: bifunctional proline dehydrogenase/L-glutamate gamma-semialdehyde dehydrogenase [Gordonia sp. (in: high G+C Gram-positive bacteria)]